MRDRHRGIRNPPSNDPCPKERIDLERRVVLDEETTCS